MTADPITCAQFVAMAARVVTLQAENRVGFPTHGHYSGMREDRRSSGLAQAVGDWSVNGMAALLDAVYWTEAIDDDWHWCIECECLIETPQLVEHLCREHVDCRALPPDDADV